MGKIRDPGPDYSAKGLEDCPCGGGHIVKLIGLHAKRCQECWRDGLPCIEWRAKFQRHLCFKCYQAKTGS